MFTHRRRIRRVAARADCDAGRRVVRPQPIAATGAPPRADARTIIGGNILVTAVTAGAGDAAVLGVQVSRRTGLPVTGVTVRTAEAVGVDVPVHQLVTPGRGIVCGVGDVPALAEAAVTLGAVAAVRVGPVGTIPTQRRVVTGSVAGIGGIRGRGRRPQSREQHDATACAPDFDGSFHRILPKGFENSCSHSAAREASWRKPNIFGAACAMIQINCADNTPTGRNS